MIKKITTLVLLFAFVFYSFPIPSSAHELLECTNITIGGDWRLSSDSKWYEPTPFGASYKNPNESSMKYASTTLERTASNMGFNKCNDWGDFYEQHNTYKEFNLIYRVKKISDTKVNFIVETRNSISLEAILNMDSSTVDSLGEISTSSSKFFVDDLNSDILITSDPMCTSGEKTTFGFIKKVWADCTTYGLSADGRVGTATYHKEDESLGGWLLTLLSVAVGVATGGLLAVPVTGFLAGSGLGYATTLLTDAITQTASLPEILGTVEESLEDTINGGGKLGVGKWEWTEKAFSPTPPITEEPEEPIVETPSPTLNFSTWPAFYIPEQVSLYWKSENADYCVASGDWPEIGNKPANGEERFPKDRGEYFFTLKCVGPGGEVTEEVSTKVKSVPRCDFKADPTSIISPQSSTLSWECYYADSCSIDQRIGEVNNISDSIKVSPTSTTVYKLFCQGEGDSKEYKATVNVGFIPIIKEVAPY